MAAKTVNKSVAEEKTPDKVTMSAENAVERAELANSAKNTSSASKYTIDELVAAEKELGANKVIIRTALSKEKEHLFTVDEAKEIVSKFKQKEVK